ncbi:hypothetical protein AO703_16360 [[Enterobacter] lignolyticus]|uniref:Uncharacterized protein n=1 Tax=[Enterobacter] lignolyticus TaxID=1334193 RepID=A0A806X6Y0_9ENTR|nr:hypothetical protein AO703_16360 [[Enterobacter] lignolyticus]
MDYAVSVFSAGERQRLLRRGIEIPVTNGVFNQDVTLVWIMMLNQLVIFYAIKVGSYVKLAVGSAMLRRIRVQIISLRR